MEFLQSPTHCEIIPVTIQDESSQSVTVKKASINDTSQTVSINGLIQSYDNYYFENNTLFFTVNAPIRTGDVIVVHYAY